MKTTPLIEIQHPGFPAADPPSGGRQGRSLPLAARVFALALLLPSMAGAWVINVQYGPYNNENGQSGNASMAGRTGPSSDTGTTWNSFLGTLGSNAYHGAQASNAALVDSTGNPTPAKLTFLAGEGYAKPGSNTDSLPVFRSAVYVNSSSPTNFVISGLSPGTLYDLYALSGGAPSATYFGTFHVSGATVSASQSSTNTGPFNAFNSSNTLLFPNLAPTADGKLTLTMEGGTYPTSNGFQLVSQGSSDTYTLNYTAGPHGSISSGNATQTGVPFNGSGTAVTALADTGYHFVNWSDSSTSNPRTDSPVTGNVSVTANFAINTYTLSYSAGSNGLISSGNATQTGVLYNGSGTAVTAQADTGYHFVNWSDSSTSNPRTDSPVTADLSVTANFAINTYMVTYDNNGGSGSQTDGTAHNYNMLVTVLGAGTMTKSGDTFAGWNTAANGSGTGYVTGNTFAITAGTTLYAQWAPNLSFVELKDNGGITGKELTLTCVVPRAASFSLSGGTQTATLGGVTYIVEASTDLSTWTGTVANISASDTPPAGTTGWPTFSGTDFWEYRVFSAFDGVGGKGFIRRVITQP